MFQDIAKAPWPNTQGLVVMLSLAVGHVLPSG